MKIDDFTSNYKDHNGHGRGYDPGEFPEFSKERVKQMLKDLLELAAEKAKVKQSFTKTGFPTLGGTIDKESILNIFEE